MKKILILSILLLSQASFAALPPEYQNEKDLKVMVHYALKYSKVISTLQSIDLNSKTIYFGNNCQAHFSREKQHHSEGWVGPAAPLVFSKSNCKIDE